MRWHCTEVHEKVRAHACPNCDGVAFGEMGNLNQHIDTVHLKLRDHVPLLRGRRLWAEEQFDEAPRRGALGAA